MKFKESLMTMSEAKGMKLIMKEKNKIIKILIIVFLTVMLIFGVYYIKRINNYIYLTQFTPSSTRQMMGYGIKSINGKIIVIDGGTKEDAPQLESYIEDNGGKVDCWFITHPHIDHAGAFEVISENKNIEIDIEPEINDIIKIDNVAVKILGVKNPEITNNAINNQSMVFQIKVNHKKILFLGDTGVESSEKLIKNQRENLKADIVQVAHHGQSGATEEFYKIVKPKICLWPTPEWLWNNNANGAEDSGPWKTKETRKWMEDLKVKQNYVAKDGIQDIKIF